MNVDGYLQRIDFSGSRAPTADTLIRIQRAHLLTIPYEGIDVYRGVPVGLALPAIYEKIVERQRGGWCFEMNSLLHWALVELGFDAVRINSSVGVTDSADYDTGGHMLLRVMLDGVPWLADVGFGNAFLDPIPLAAGKHQQYFHTMTLRRGARAGYWIFDTHAQGGAGYVLHENARGDDAFESMCALYQSDPGSTWRRRLNCLIFEPDGCFHEQRGAVAHHVTRAGRATWEINDAAVFATRLRSVFKLTLSDADITALWAQVRADHLAWVASQTRA